jgi:cytochrome P450
MTAWLLPLEIATALLVPLVPAWRVAGHPEMRRQFPRVAVAVGAAFAAWIVLVLAVALWMPTALHVIAAGAVIAALADLWITRPGFGRGRQLPPGSLSIPESLIAIADRDFYRAQAAQHGPVFKMLQFHQPTVCVMGLERGHRLIQAHEDALGPSLQRVTAEVPGGFLRYMDRETHAVYGPLFRMALSAAVVADASPAIHEAAAQEIAGAAAGDGRGVDPTPILERVTDAAFLRVLFGIEPGSPRYEEILRAYGPLGRLPLSSPMTPASRESLAAVRRLVTMEPRFPAGRSALTELQRLDPSMPDATCLDNLVFIWKVSASNAVGLLRWVLAHLGENPEWASRLVTSSRTGDGQRDLTDRIIQETLRISQSEYLYRRIQRDITFDGFRLPKGWLLRVCVAESHRDPKVFKDPERFDPDRFVRDYPRTAFSPFGSGRHACNGVPLAMEITRAFLEELSRSCDWSIAGDATREREFRHWSHWRPGSGLRLVMRARTPAGAPALTASATGRGQSAPAAAGRLP